jgi:hypothetical protein
MDRSLMAPVACSKCPVVAYETASGGWRFDPSIGCVDLQDTEWGAKGELQWCPTLAAAMPDEVFWPGRSHRDHVMQIAGRVQAEVKASSKKDSET